MADIATVWNVQTGTGDWYYDPPQAGLITDETGASILDQAGAALDDGLFSGGGDLEVGDDLYTAVLISLFTDRAADTDDVIPDGSSDPRGWWGDIGEDRPIGSKIWLRLRLKPTDTTLALVKSDIEQALQWLIDDQVAAQVSVTTSWIRPGWLSAVVVITRADGTTVTLPFDWAWKEL